MLIGVYGSLRKGFGNNVLLNHKRVKFVDTIAIEYSGEMISLGGFPGLVPDKDKRSVIIIEVYDIGNTNDPENRESRYILKSLDSLEGFNGKIGPHNFYNRIPIETNLGQVHIYELASERTTLGSTVVEGGDWVEFVAERSKARENVLSES